MALQVLDLELASMAKQRLTSLLVVRHLGDKFSGTSFGDSINWQYCYRDVILAVQVVKRNDNRGVAGV